MSNKLKLKDKVLKAIKEVAVELAKDPSELTSAEFISQTEFTSWQLRSLGGFKSFLSLHFPQNRDLVTVTGSKIIKAHRNKLEKQYGTELFMTDEITKVLVETLNKVKFYTHAPVVRKSSGTKKSRTIVAQVSDTHYGANIMASEMGNVNEFNWEIAARRTALYAEQIVTYKLEYREDTDLVIALNGDVIAGMIHNQEFFSDLLTDQFAGALNILTQFVSYCALHFDKVTVYCSPGNHGRAMHKMSKERGSTHKWDSYETMLYVALAASLKSHKNIQVNIPSTPYAIYDVQGHPIFQTHGDTVINVGNPGTSLNMKSINTQISKLNSSKLRDASNFAAILVGHVHTALVHQADNGCTIVVNGTLSASDPFVQSIGIFSNNPTQVLFEATKEYAVGDMRFVHLENADKDASLDKIIKPYIRRVDG